MMSLTRVILLLTIRAHVIMLPHPEYAKIYIAAKYREIIIDILEELFVEHNIDAVVPSLNAFLSQFLPAAILLACSIRGLALLS